MLKSWVAVPWGTLIICSLNNLTVEDSLWLFLLSLQSRQEEPKWISQCQTRQKQLKWVFQVVPTCGMNKMGCRSPLIPFVKFTQELVQKVQYGAVHQSCAQHQWGNHSWEGAVEILPVAELLNFLSELPARAKSNHSARLTPSCPSWFLPPQILG